MDLFDNALLARAFKNEARITSARWNQIAGTLGIPKQKAQRKLKGYLKNKKIKKKHGQFLELAGW